MHPWMLEQLGREHRKELQALGAPRTYRKISILKRRQRKAQPGSPAASAASIAVARPANAVSG